MTIPGTTGDAHTSTRCEKCLERIRDIIANGVIVLRLEADRMEKFLAEEEKRVYGVQSKKRSTHRKINSRRDTFKR